MPIGLWYPSGFYNGKITLVSGINQNGSLNTKVLTWDPARTGSKWSVSSYNFTTPAYPHALQRSAVGSFSLESVSEPP